MFYRSLERAAVLVNNPLVWRSMIRGYADGITLAETLKRGGWLASTAARLEARRAIHQGSTEATEEC